MYMRIYVLLLTFVCIYVFNIICVLVYIYLCMRGPQKQFCFLEFFL